MSIALFLRLYSSNIADGKLRADFYIEHKAIISKRSNVALGKAGKALPAKKMDWISKLLKAKGNLPIYFYDKKLERLYLGRIKKIDNKWPADSSLYPNYYSLIINIGTWFYLNRLSQIDIGELDSLSLYTNKRPIRDVLRDCRTSFMVVEKEGS